MDYHIKDITGQKFNRWTVLNFVETRNHNAYWLARCECGTERILSTAYLTSGMSQSCGCLRTERAKEFKKYGELERDDKNHPVLYKRYHSIKQRCYNPSCHAYYNYGARGIKMCDEWNDDFIAFYNWSMNSGYRDDLTLDRIDNNGDYCPENCRWVDRRTQQNNLRRNVYLEYAGLKKMIPEWAKI